MKFSMEVEGTGKTISVFELTRVSVREDIKKSMFRGVAMIANRADEIIVEKGHVVTGNLHRNMKSKAGMVGAWEIEGVAGTDVPYAPFIEALPDGGFLQAAYMQRKGLVITYIASQIKAVLRALVV